MKFVTQCKNCEYNHDGICYEGGELYKYEEEILDSSKACEHWNTNFEYYCYTLNNAPRFLREQLEDCHITYGKFYQLLENYDQDKPVKLNIFDAIKYVYGISMVDIAVALNVSFGVVYRAKTRGIPQKRIDQFADGLCIPKELLLSVSTTDFPELQRCKEQFTEKYSRDLLNMPEWKNNLARDISQMFHCPIHIANKIATVDKMYWDKDVVEDKYTDGEKTLIKFLTRKKRDGGCVTEIEYFLDLACSPHLRYEQYNKN